ncbi:YhgE/Pip family protein [uncultured Enorma sp.]|uniref:YhgE/Pip family protein n=1 Tax=uncultured Enorma sp. TaxID=1714346 RepID=UPI002805BB2C|nr:YhgE/Pip family protein [uncultured Enorma sp.]
MIRLLVDAVRDVSARLASRRFALVLVLVLALPAVFALVFTAATAPALDGQARIPVAVVNLDEGIDGARGSTVNSGAELVDDLMDSSELAWDAVDEDTALAGLTDGTYALVLEIPADYSEKVASVDGSDPARAQIQIISSGSENVLATRAGSAALKQVQSRLRADLGEQYMLRVLNSVNGQASTLSLTADGAVMLDSAYDALEQGTVAIAEGLEQTASGTAALSEGVDAIASGVTAAGTGAGAIADAMTQTADGYEQLAGAAETLPTGLEMISEQLVGAGEELSEYSGGFSSLANRLGVAADGLSMTPDLAAQVEGHSDALASAASTMGTTSDEALRAGGALVAAVDDGEACYSDTKDAAAALAQELSSDAPDSIGILQELNDLDERYDELTEELRALAAQADMVPASELSAIVDELDALDTRRAALSDRVEAAAQQSDELSDNASASAEALAGVGTQRDRFADAVASYTTSTASANDAAGKLAELIPQVVEPTEQSVQVMRMSQGVLEEAGPGLAEAGRGFASMGFMLSSDGLIGQGVSALATGVAATPQALTGFSNAVDQLGQGNLALGSALGQVGTGISGLGEGLSALAGVQGQLASGVGQLREGQQTINETLSVAGDELGELASSRDERAEVAASPVTLTTTTLDRTEGSAASVAPIAFGIVLWAGALAASYVLPLADRRAVLAGRTIPSVLAGFVLTTACCLAQAAVAGVLLTVFGGASPVHAAGFAALLAFASLAFAAVAQALRLTCGRLAGAVSLSLLFVQLLCAGAILPVFFTGGIFSALGQVLPVPALIGGLRGAMAGSLANFGGACLVLALWLAVGLATSLLCTARLRFVRPERAFA